MNIYSTDSQNQGNGVPQAVALVDLSEMNEQEPYVLTDDALPPACRALRIADHDLGYYGVTRSFHHLDLNTDDPWMNDGPPALNQELLHLEEETTPIFIEDVSVLEEEVTRAANGEAIEETIYWMDYTPPEEEQPVNEEDLPRVIELGEVAHLVSKRNRHKDLIWN